jgi:broad specificity phosphatase PhoE
MATFYLIRHGTNDWLGKGLAGRLPNVHLNAQGQAEAERLAETLAAKGIRRILSSPLERALETAAPLARKLDLKLEISEALLEVDFGDWTGRTLAELREMPQWSLFNSHRSGARIPNGESIIEVQSRMVLGLQGWQREDPAGAFALFSHGDPIRAALVYFLGMPLDLLTRLEVSPGSFSVARLEEWGQEILGINGLPV